VITSFENDCFHLKATGLNIYPFAMYDALSCQQIAKIRLNFERESRVLSAFLHDVCSLPGCLRHVLTGGGKQVRQLSRAWVGRMLQVAFTKAYIEVRDPEYLERKLGISLTVDHIPEAIQLGRNATERAHPFYRIKLGLTPAGLGRLNYLTTRLEAVDFVLAERRRLGQADAFLRSERVQRRKARTQARNRMLAEYEPLCARKRTRAPLPAYTPPAPAPVIEPPPTFRSNRLRMPTPIHHATQSSHHAQPSQPEQPNHTRPPALDARDRADHDAGEGDRASA